MRNGEWARRPARSLRVAFLLGTLVGLAAPAAAQVRYTNGVGLENLGGTGEHNAAFGINEAGHMVGTAGASGKRAVLYTDEAGLRDLNTLIDPALGWVLLAANDINDAGEIVGYGFNNLTQETHAVRLVPTGAP